MNEKIQKFKQLVDESKNIVFFGGAGVSTESGIPDFRSKDGLYNQKYKYPPETILSHTFFLSWILGSFQSILRTSYPFKTKCSKRFVPINPDAPVRSILI